MDESAILTEHILLDVHLSTYIAMSLRGTGILAKALVGRHERRAEERRTALAFATQVIQAFSVPSATEQPSTPQILVEAADAVITDPLSLLTCTSWRWLPEGMEICSIGANCVLLCQGGTTRLIIAPIARMSC